MYYSKPDKRILEGGAYPRTHPGNMPYDPRIGTRDSIVCAPKAGPLSGFSVFSQNVPYQFVANDWNTTFTQFHTY